MRKILKIAFVCSMLITLISTFVAKKYVEYRREVVIKNVKRV